MPFINKISKYKLHYFTRGSTSEAASDVARIYLYDDDNKSLGIVYFVKDGRPVPDNSAVETSNPKRAYLRYNERLLPRITDMLRNEKPCWVYYYGPTYAAVQTSAEPVGEEEIEE